MARTRVDAEFKRRASFAIIWQDLVMPVRAILDYQEIIVEEDSKGLRAGKENLHVAPLLASIAPGTTRIKFG